MNNDWGGAFSNPIMKHYRHPKKDGERHPHHLPDHIEIVDVTQLTDDEIDEHDADPDSDYEIDELVQLGGGRIPWLVAMTFVPGDGPYEFVVYSDEEPDTESLKSQLAAYFTPE